MWRLYVSSARCSGRLQMCLAAGTGLSSSPTPAGAQVRKQSRFCPLPAASGAGLKERRSPPPSNVVGAAVVLCLLPPCPVPPHTQCLRTRVSRPRDGSGMTSFADPLGGRGSDAGHRARKARGRLQAPHSPPSSLTRKYPASCPRSGASQGEFLGVPREVGRRV